MGAVRILSFLLILSGALTALALLAVGSASAGSAWQTATVVDTPIIDQALHFNANEEQWYRVPRSGTQVFNFSVAIDTVFEVDLYAGDATGGPTTTVGQYGLDPSVMPVYGFSLPWAPAPDFFLRLANPASDPGSLNGTHVTLTLGSFEPHRLVSGESFFFHLQGTSRQFVSTNSSLMFNNSLLGGTDGIWQVRATLVRDNSNYSGAGLDLGVGCYWGPRCSPTDLPSSYSCNVFVPAPCKWPEEGAGVARLEGNGSTLIMGVAETGRGLTYLGVSAGWRTGIPSGLTPVVDITFWINVTWAPLPAANADDYPAGAHNVASHQPWAGALAQATNREDFYAFDAPGVPITISALMSGPTYTDGSNRNGYLLLITEMFLYNSTMHMVAASNSMLDRSNFNCFGCVAGSSAILLPVPGSIPAGERLYLSFHVLMGGGTGTLDSLAYNLTVPLPNRAPVPVAGNDTFAFDEDTDGWFDLNTMFTDADGDSFVFYAYVAGGLSVLTSVTGDMLTVYPPTNGSGVALLVITANDRWPNGMTEANLTVTVRPVNDPPTATKPPQRVNWSQGESTGPLDPSTLFSDVDGDALVYSYALPAGLEAGSCGRDCFTLRAISNDTWGNFTGFIVATDPSGANVSLAVWVQIFHVNRAPLKAASAPENLTMVAGTTPTLFQSATFCRDPDQDPVTFSLWTVSPSPSPFASSNPPGSFDELYISVPDADTGGAWDLALACTDDSQVQTLIHVMVTVRPANLAPLFLGRLPSSGTPTFAENTSATLSAEFSDPEGLELAYHWQLDGRTVTGASTNRTTVAFDFTAAGGHQVTVQATDPGGKSALTTWDIQVTNVDRPPTCGIVAVDGNRGDEGDVFHFTAAAQDPDGDSLAYAWSVEGLQKGNAGDLAFTLPSNSTELHLRVSGGSLSTTCNLTLFVNLQPLPLPNLNGTNQTQEPGTAQPKGFLPGFEVAGAVAAVAAAAAGIRARARRRI